jgi:hypothetical protein
VVAPFSGRAWASRTTVPVEGGTREYLVLNLQPPADRTGDRLTFQVLTANETESLTRLPEIPATDSKYVEVYAGTPLLRIANADPLSPPSDAVAARNVEIHVLVVNDESPVSRGPILEFLRDGKSRPWLLPSIAN